MGQLTARQIARAVEVLSPSDSVGRAAEMLRASGLPAAPVGENGHLHGMVTEADLMEALRRCEALVSMGEQADTISIRDIMSREVVAVSSDARVEDLAHLFAHHPVGAVPVIDETGRYLGIVTRADVTSAIFKTMRPPRIGGMATPLGVFLTSGNATAGANRWGLFLTGALMIVIMAVTQVVLFAVVFTVDHARGTRWTDVLLSPQIAALRGAFTLHYVWVGLQILLFFPLLRMLPLAGYHAAEHQTVHAIERGAPLNLSIVRTMPRAHPRCGTNVAVFLLLLFTLTQLMNPIAAMAITLLTWRFLGMLLQQYFTTKPATDAQLRNGICAGEELIQKYQEHAAETRATWKRLWNSGLPHVVAGGATAYGLGQLILWVWIHFASQLVQ